MANALALPKLSNHSSRATSSTASTHSTVSTATTLEGSFKASKKWFSKAFDPKYTTRSDAHYAEKATHHEAIASYLSLR